MSNLNVNNASSISCYELISLFGGDKTIRTGCITVFNDSIGKPGDRISELKEITYQNNEFHFSFGEEEKVIIISPEKIAVSQNMMEIGNAKKIIWSFKELILSYERTNQNIATKILTGQHCFRINASAAAFMLYSW